MSSSMAYHVNYFYNHLHHHPHHDCERGWWLEWLPPFSGRAGPQLPIIMQSSIWIVMVMVMIVMIVMIVMVMMLCWGCVGSLEYHTAQGWVSFRPVIMMMVTIKI